MAKRNLNDQEISLIKAMINRGYKNNFIQHYFNRQDRPVNSGRISEIKSKKIGSNIIPATEIELNEFIDEFSIPHTVKETNRTEMAKKLFKEIKLGKWEIVDGETDEQEYKLDFSTKPEAYSKIIRSIVALFNNKGGYIFFGVSDDYSVTGMTGDFDQYDIAKLMDKVGKYLFPTPKITTKSSFTLGEHKIGFIYVEPHPDHPVIVQSEWCEMKEGTIFYRYAGKTSPIKFAELKSMLDERDRRARLALAEVAGKIATIEPANTLIFDAKKNAFSADGHDFLIDEELAQKIKFIREGHFDEVDGAPALKLIGGVTPVNVIQDGQNVGVPKAISQEDILLAFLEQQKVVEPFEYIKAAISQPKTWIPLHYFVKLSDRNITDIISDLKKIETSQKKKKEKIIHRLNNILSAFSKNNSSKVRPYIKKIENGEISVPKEESDINFFLQGVCSFSKTICNIDDILFALINCHKISIETKNSNLQSLLYKGACRVDEFFFKTH